MRNATTTTTTTKQEARRIKSSLSLILTCVLVLLAAVSPCQAFTTTTTTTIGTTTSATTTTTTTTTTTASWTRNRRHKPVLVLYATEKSQQQQQQQQPQQPASKQPKPQTKSNVKAKKPPRFAQTVHKSSSSSSFNNNNNNNATPPPPPPPRPSNTVLRNNKSLEELEDILAKRWGTHLSAFTAQDWDDDDDDDDDDDKDKSTTTTTTTTSVRDNNDNNKQADDSAFVFRSKPVMDPWQKNKDTRQQDKKKTRHTTTREYYDEDDEGYENNNNNNNNSRSSSSSAVGRSSSLSLNHVIAPKPAGATGRTNRPLSLLPEQESYFLRPPPPPPPPSTITSPTKNEAKTSTIDSTMAPPSSFSSSSFSSSSRTDKDDKDHFHNKNNKTTRERIAPLPLLDEDGDPICLSLIQAERIFYEQTTAGGGSGATFVDYEKNKKEVNQEKENDDEHQVDDDNNNEDNDDEYFDNEEEFPLAALAAQSNQQWSDLGVTDSTLLDNLAEMSCSVPLPVQQKACANVLNGQSDVVIGTYTGSGKTLAFLVPLVQRLVDHNISPDQLSILVVAPGRELASQIVSVTRQVCQGTPYTAHLAIGGTTFTRNLQTIRQRKPSIVVGTPGRLAELIVGKPGEKGGRLKANQLQALVLDEFDALLEYKPHREPTCALVEKLQRNQNLQTILCSATATDVLESPKFQRFVRPDYALALTDQDDVFVTSLSDGNCSSKQPAPRVSRTVMHGVVHVPHRRFVIETIRRILHTEPLPQQILMFVDSSRKVDLLVEKLEDKGILAAALHGGSRNDKMDRAEVSKALREGYVGIVVATELAARGLDAPLLTHVINVDLPTDASHYAHRAGRCGRGGRPGVVINLTADPKERKVPQKFANQLGIDLHTVDVRNGRLNVVNPETVDFENL